MGCDKQIVFTCVFYTHSIPILFQFPKYGQEGNSRKMDSCSRVSQGADPCSICGQHHRLLQPPLPHSPAPRISTVGLTLPRPSFRFWARKSTFSLETQNDLFSFKKKKNTHHQMSHCLGSHFSSPHSGTRTRDAKVGN